MKTAYNEKETVVKDLLGKQGIGDRYEIFLRAFKRERTLEVWVKGKDTPEYKLLITYPFCTSSGELGPKRREGDLQIPEGVYKINHFNPYSNFYLSLGVNYPNASDRILGDKERPGGAIYIHGNCVSIGCIPITDEKIKELYILAVESRNAGQAEIPVHIFPGKEIKELIVEFPEHGAFWRNLQIVYEDFEQTKKLRTAFVRASGEYHF